MATKIKITLKTHPTYEYAHDDNGVYCRNHISTDDWVALEPHCLNCGRPALQRPYYIMLENKARLLLPSSDSHTCDCGDFIEAPYVCERTNTLHIAYDILGVTKFEKTLADKYCATKISQDYWNGEEPPRFNDYDDEEYDDEDEDEDEDE